MPSIDRDTFLSHLAASGLVEPAQLRAVLADLPDSPRGRSVARRLVKRGVLTRFQAELLLAGRTDGFVLGQYRILEEIGRGGMGRVFKAEHLSMRRVVALKVLAAQLTRTERARQLFQREVRAAARLVHPNIVTAFDANSVGDRHFLVLEFVDGPNLSALVKEQGPLPVGQACDFVRQVALGLQHAHELGMVHRDVKPSNLLVSPPRVGPPPVSKTLAAGGVVKILDFGLARLCEPGPEGEAADDTAFGGGQIVMGTPDYLSPEQGRSLHDVDIRSDLYSLGCTLYYLLTARVPFPGGTSLEKLVRHATVDPEPAEDLRPVMPPGVAAILRRLLAKDPADRPQTPAELAETLEPFAEIAPVTWRGTRAAGPGTLSTSSSADLEGSSDSLPARGSLSGADLSLSGTQGVDGQSTKLSQAELNLIRSRSRFWRLWLRPLLFLLAVALGFALGVSLILMVR